MFTYFLTSLSAATKFLNIFLPAKIPAARTPAVIKPRTRGELPIFSLLSLLMEAVFVLVCKSSFLLPLKPKKFIKGFAEFLVLEEFCTLATEDSGIEFKTDLK